MPQSLVLTTPIIPAPAPSTTTFTVVRLVIERSPFARVSFTVISNTGTVVDTTYQDDLGGTTAAQIISALNTANLSVKSLQQRILERMVADGKLPAGSITGVPD